MIVEPRPTMLLHCDRDNEPLLDDYERPILWDGAPELTQAFGGGFYADWARIGSRYLCPGCWNGDEDHPVEAGPLKAVDEIRVLKERAAYAAARPQGGETGTPERITAEHMTALAGSRLDAPALVRHKDGSLAIISTRAATYRFILDQDALDAPGLKGRTPQEQAACAADHEEGLIEGEVAMKELAEESFTDGASGGCDAPATPVPSDRVHD